MKTTRMFLLVTSLVLATRVSAVPIVVTGYGVIKQYGVTQTSSSAPVAGSATPYSLSAYVFGTNLAGTYGFTPPGGSAANLTINGGNNGADFQSSGYADPAALNAVYANGIFSMALPNSAGPNSASLPSLTGDAFPELPQITTGSWIGGMLQVSATQNYTINFSSFASFSSDDSYKLSIRDQFDNEVASGFWNTAGTTSFLLNASTLTAGQVYSASLQFNNNFIDYGTTISGANGNAGYTTINEFQIQAIPEPSTCAAIFGAVACLGVAFQRRRALPGVMIHNCRRMA